MQIVPLLHNSIRVAVGLQTISTFEKMKVEWQDASDMRNRLNIQKKKKNILKNYLNFLIQSLSKLLIWDRRPGVSGTVDPVIDCAVTRGRL